MHKSRRQDYATKVRLSSKCNEYCDKIAYLLTKYDICVYLSKIKALFEHDLEKIGSAVSKHSANLRSSGFSPRNLEENSKKIGGV